MADEVVVTPDDLRSHARHLDTIAENVDTAKQAGDAVRPGIDAYGKLCVLVPVMLEELQSPLVDAIAAAGESLHSTADQVRTAADAYDDTDMDNSIELRDAGSWQ